MDRLLYDDPNFNQALLQSTAGYLLSQGWNPLATRLFFKGSKNEEKKSLENVLTKSKTAL